MMIFVKKIKQSNVMENKDGGWEKRINLLHIDG